MALFGSLEYALTWKQWAMKSGQPICALRALRHPKNARVCSGPPYIDPQPAAWPAPTGTNNNPQVRGQGKATRESHRGTTLSGMVTHMLLHPWYTPLHADGRGSAGVGKRELSNQAKSAPWPPQPWTTPAASDSRRGGRQTEQMTGSSLAQQSQYAPWPAPCARDYKHPNKKSFKDRGGESKGEQLANFVVHGGAPTHGSPASSSSAPTGKSGVLNPAFTRWLMGFPDAWDACAPTVTPSSRKSRRNS